MGWEDAEGPEVEAEYFNFDALELPARPPRADLAGHVPRRAGGGSTSGAAHPHLTSAGADACWAANVPVYVGMPGAGVPHR